MIKVLAGLAACALAATSPAAASPAAAPPRGAQDGLAHTFVSCATLNVGTLRFGTFAMSSDRGTFSAPLTVRCDESATYRVRLTSANNCRLLGPRGDAIRYAIYGDAGYREGVLDCSAGPVDLPGRGTMTFHLYGQTAPLLNLAAGAYGDSVSIQVLLDKPGGTR